ncbi:hypothetical protein BN7_4489 [Wickerhamomyces ciferrii]|uniref:Protein SOK1 n=1 Tax=Wickerhamomyces ciferrii (strain ATCC 14091 / BCRC 22168 / CBS 111 / JCM 3599 / NBRC 0793 / NRRL Y-1031 F-60-10) TaxID=1206466 RepID=K0KI83_WICCF|nr:uncharacterized protein BN7_4489 [Wickerhamomyces ciferrii]CCH44920.1 hypothetical protein BN7_4489 [Wickerhamomyces ciferrii]
MNSQLNNNQENNDQVFSEDNTFRNVFINQPATTNQDSNHTKRARLDSTISLNQPTNNTTNPPNHHHHSHHTHHTHQHSHSHETPVNMENGKIDIPPLSFESCNQTLVSTPTACTSMEDVNETLLKSTDESQVINEDLKNQDTIKPQEIKIPNQQSLQSLQPQRKSSTTTKRKHKSLASSKIRKFRSRSLPNILFSNKNFDLFQSKIKEPTSSSSIFKNINSSSNTASSSSNHTSSQPPLPPVNIQSLREIDLAEILKNPQLRHDILFDPQLQFRPNLDGERGRRKKVTYDKYWSTVQFEIEEYYQQKTTLDINTSRLPNLFQTLRDILISLLPSKDKQTVIDVLDIELIMQQLAKNSLDLVELAKWLSSIFKSHCAPMRDSWVDEMLMKFVEADEIKSVLKLVEGLRMIFTILEAMKLDVANHQIRILRPVLVETAVEFERDYFLQMIARCKLDISDSIKWFKNFQKQNPVSTQNNNHDASIQQKITTTQAILSLLSCSKMVSEFPSSLAFDHARLIVLRANVRQVVCLQLCIALFKQLAHQSQNSQQITPEICELLKKEILALITDENGNVKWTRNIGAIALQISRHANPQLDVPNEKVVEFAFSWLIKQTQPSSQVYHLMEQRVFNIIKDKCISELNQISSSLSSSTNTIESSGKIMPVAGNSINSIPSSSPSTSTSNPTTITTQQNEEDDIGSIASRISLLAKFHWNVFGSYYTSD